VPGQRLSPSLIVGLSITSVAILGLTFGLLNTVPPNVRAAPPTAEDVLGFAVPPVAALGGIVAVFAMLLNNRPRWLAVMIVVLASLTLQAYFVAGLVQFALFGR
jgi:hypothetical protein